jgi:hypothetical protein
MAKKQRLTMVVDAGNGNVKVAVGGQTELIPSVYSENEGSYIRGGFKLADKDYILGWDNCNRLDKVDILAKDDGKVENLHILLAGAVSAMKHVISAKVGIDLYLLTLNGNQRQRITEKVAEVSGLSIDGIDYQNDLKLVQLYPEGYGASLYAAKVFQEVSRVAVLDIGNGTLNLSQYHTKAGYPRREMFYYLPFGFSSIVSNAVTLFTEDTSNGVVNDGLIREAMVSNTYLYLSDYKGKNIEKTADKAVKVWLDNPKVKTTMVQVINLLNRGVPVVACGGGFEVSKVRDGISLVLGYHPLFHVPEKPISLGVTGLYEELTKTEEMTANVAAA